MTMVAVVLTWAALAFGLFVVVLLVVAAVRRHRTWSEPGLQLTAEQRAELQDPAQAGAQPPAMGGIGAEAEGVFGAQVRNDRNVLGNG